MHDSRRWMMRWLCGWVLLLPLACGAPITVHRVDPVDVQRAMMSNVLSTGELSAQSLIVLQRYDLRALWHHRPARALAALHATLDDVGSSGDELFALAELSFAHAQEKEAQSWFLASAVYALAFLFPGGELTPVGAFDPRYRLACDLYNRSITAALLSGDDDVVQVEGGRFELPFGSIEITVDEGSLLWGGYRLTDFVPVAELEVRGLRNRHRRPGLGAALAADLEPLPGQKQRKPPLLAGLRVPVTALLDVDVDRESLVKGELRGRLVLHPPAEAESVTISGHEVPLEIESTSALAYGLARSPLWNQEITGFLSGALTGKKTRLTASQPYRPGLIPVVLVHGTASSPARWAELLNDLGDDPRFRGRFQAWFFQYDTGNPVLYSSYLLRQALEEAVRELDPEGLDPALRDMVVVGHSQGGLLTKLTAIDSGSRFWDNISSESFDEIELPADTRTLLQEAIFVDALPFVKRVVFIATPHRGSFAAGWGISHLFARFVSLPGGLLRAGRDLVTASPELAALVAVDGMPNAVKNMTPDDPFIQVLASIPVRPPVVAHSIIAVDWDEGDVIEEGDDGVVEYTSAHIDEAVSELVVRSGHSVQAHPRTIEEMRRILIEHGDAYEAQLAELKLTSQTGR